MVFSFYPHSIVWSTFVCNSNNMWLYLSQCSWSDTYSIQHPQRNHKCWRESEKSSNGIAPPGVFISVVEFEWSIFDQREEKCALKENTSREKTSHKKTSKWSDYSFVIHTEKKIHNWLLCILISWVAIQYPINGTVLLPLMVLTTFRTEAFGSCQMHLLVKHEQSYKACLHLQYLQYR